MGLDKFEIPKLAESSRKTIPKNQRNTMNDPIVERNKEARNKDGNKTSGEIVETRSQNVSEDKQTTLEVEID